LFLTYVLAVLLTCVVIVLVGAPSEKTTTLRLAAGGLMFGLLLFTRPIEGLMLGVAVVLWITVRDGIYAFVRMMVPMVAGALPVLILMLIFNRATTGDPLRFPLWAVGGNDAFGFGDRTIAAGAPVVHYGPAEAWLTLRTNLRAFPHWLFGGLATVPLAGWGAVTLWRTRRSALVLLTAIALIYPIGYFFYWGQYLIIAGRNFIGPHYFLGLLLPAAALIAAGATDLVRRRKHVLYLLLPLLLVGTTVELKDKIDVNVGHRDGSARELQAVRTTVHSPAVVVLPASEDGPYVLHPRGFFGNSPDLSDGTLFAADLLGRNVELFDRFPDRAIYRLQELDDGFGGHPDVRSLRMVHTPSLDVDSTITAADAHSKITIYAADAGHFFLSCVVSSAPSPGQTFQDSIRATAATVTLNGCETGDVTVALPPEPTTLVVGAARGPNADPGAGDETEQRYWLRPNYNGLDIITPADTWHRPQSGTAFTVVAENSVPWIRFRTAT
jgi:hypothetical protein